jgi:hypothetical protein
MNILFKHRSLVFLSLLMATPLFISAETLFPSSNTDNKPNITELKELYVTRAKYATYATIASIISYLTVRIVDYDNPFFNLNLCEFSNLCATMSATLGAGNGAKWLFFHLFPESTVSDIDTINILEKLAYAILALQLPAKYETYQNMYSKLEFWEHQR